jgi:hypothetical protein
MSGQSITPAILPPGHQTVRDGQAARRCCSRLHLPHARATDDTSATFGGVVAPGATCGAGMTVRRARITSANTIRSTHAPTSAHWRPMYGPPYIAHLPVQSLGNGRTSTPATSVATRQIRPSRLGQAGQTGNGLLTLRSPMASPTARHILCSTSPRPCRPSHCNPPAHSSRIPSIPQWGEYNPTRSGASR